MCERAGNPLPAAANGSQAAGTPCNMIPQSLINPIGQELINLYPLPNANNAALGYNYVSEPVRKLNEGKFDIRLDENLSSKDTLFARFSYDQATSYVPGGAPGLRRTGRVRQQSRHHQSRPQCGHFRDSHFFAHHRQPNQLRF